MQKKLAKLLQKGTIKTYQPKRWRKLELNRRTRKKLLKRYKSLIRQTTKKWKADLNGNYMEFVFDAAPLLTELAECSTKTLNLSFTNKTDSKLKPLKQQRSNSRKRKTIEMITEKKKNNCASNSKP